MRTIDEISTKAYIARGKANKPTAKSEMYHQIERLAVDHPEMYNEDRFRSELSGQTFKLGVFKKRLDDINSRTPTDKVTGKYKYCDFDKEAVAKIKADIRSCERYIRVCLYILGEKESI